MRLSASLEYAAIAALSITCYGRDHGPVSLRAICEEQGVPSRFLVHVLLQLKRAGIVKSARGSGGGYLLARPPEEITLLDIYRAIEGTTVSPAKLTSGFAAKSRGAAVLKKAWDGACREWNEKLDSFTLADLARRTLNTDELMYYI